VLRRAICVFMTAVSIAVVASALAVPSVHAADVDALVEQMEASWPDWLPKPDQCPADLMPAHETTFDFSIERCSAETAQCLDRCRAGEAADCYATALVFQKVRNGRVPEALFLKACALGLVSGCTNRAAGMDRVSNGNQCTIRTYEKACDLNDPWACTMFGFHLIRATGGNRDHDRARKAFAKSCRFGEDDPACAGAKALLKQIGN
jgi:hypothetical protein